MKVKAMMARAKTKRTGSTAAREARVERAGAPVEGPLVGTIVAVSESGDVKVDYAENLDRGAIAARTTVPIEPGDVGRDVVLVFDRGNANAPIILGVIAPKGKRRTKRVDLEIDRRKVSVTAREQIVLSCGAASITLTRAGKVMIRGTYVVTRSSGVNRVQGAVVELN